MNDSLKNAPPSFEQYFEKMMGALAENDRRIEKKIKKLFRRLHPIKAAITFCGLSSIEDLQSDHIKITNLIHASLKYGRGKKEIRKTQINELFGLVGESKAGRDEDPAEDVFIARLCTEFGTFHIFEGNWEGSTFFLERFISILDSMPDTGRYEISKKSVYAMLKVSDFIAKKCCKSLNIVTSEYPRKKIPSTVNLSPLNLRNRVKITDKDFKEMGIDKQELSPFIYINDHSKGLPFPCHQSLTELDKAPIIKLGGGTYYLFPQGISVAIRSYIISEYAKTRGDRENLTLSLIRAYATFLQGCHLLNGLPVPPPEMFAPILYKNILLQEFIIASPKSRPLHLIIIFSRFESEQNDWPFSSPKFMSDDDIDLKKRIEKAKNAVSKNSTVKHGITLVLFAGWGKPHGFGSNIEDTDNWSVRFLPIHDFCHLSDHPEMKPMNLWRVIQIEQKFEQMDGKIENINGFLNLYGWLLANGWHIVPHEEMPEDETKTNIMLSLPLNQIAFVRSDSRQSKDRRIVQDINGKFTEISRYSGNSYFKEDQNLPLYGHLQSAKNGNFVAVFIGKASSWWCRNYLKNDGGQDFQIWESAINWLRYVDRVIFKNRIEVPKIIDWCLTIERVKDKISRYDQIQSKLINFNKIETVIKLSSNTIFNRPDNSGEILMIQSFLTCLFAENKNISVKELIKEIFPNKDSKFCHVLLAKTFNDYIFKTLPKPILIEQADDAYLRLGLGWLKNRKGHFFKITGKKKCSNYLNEIVDKIWNELYEDLKKYGKINFCRNLVNNIESIRAQRNIWERTIRACLALHNDKKDVINAANKKSNSFNASSIGSRLLIEMAICTCPMNLENAPDELESSLLLGKAILLFYLGSWSDAIKSGLYPPEIKVSTYGQIMINYDFENSVMEPFQSNFARQQREAEADRYEKLYENPIDKTPVADVFPSKFLKAWEKEFHISLDQVRLIIDVFEDIGIEKNLAVLIFSKSDIVSELEKATGIDAKQISHFLNRMTLPTREKWDQATKKILKINCNQQDWYPWNFRRKLSLVSKPILELENRTNPTNLISPGLIRESFSYLIHNALEAIFDERHFDSIEMRKWIGNRRAELGLKFNHKVAKMMMNLGWKAESDVLVTKILNDKTTIDYGDVDVLAWSDKFKIVLAIECKDLFFAKTHKEIGNQINEFLGERNNKGKRDRLLRHFDRLAVLNDNKTAVSKYVGIANFSQVNGVLIFSNQNVIENAPQVPKDKIFVGSIDSLKSPADFKELLKVGGYSI